ncbi:hypothetical protein BO71DRAFT_486182 [Aspergillus ellipticus CBS 707.79]|uniref:Genetic interactor of prohibitins 3, mitochondrial n=1 Tax=Aspergillus ellipticus CBS 707.79 TaxID=1448320 RepID=A0A319DB31_9EURO|nr:hypothetical protein BO71DRAFT_486182 [Aspergillus ellipticus CBS 707.79]
MSPYLGRVIPRSSKLSRLPSHLQRRSLHLPRLSTRSAIFSRPEVFPVRNSDDPVQRIQPRSFSTSLRLRDSVADPEHKPELKLESENESQSEPAPESEPTSEPAPASELGSKLEPEPTPELQPEPELRSELEPEVESEIKPEVELEVEPEVKPEVDLEFETEIDPEFEPEFDPKINLRYDPKQVKKGLPLCCPGCGAYAQTDAPKEPGYYSRTRKRTKKLMSETQRAIEGQDEADGDLKTRAETAVEAIQEYLEETEAQRAGVNPKPTRIVEVAADVAGSYLMKSTPPVQTCDRCHDLRHHNRAASAGPMPKLGSLRTYIDETPHKENRIYHVIDAADFPMSVLPRIYEELGIKDPRSKNRRSATYQYKRGMKKPTISFIITRSDLLAPTKEQVDSKMPYIVSVLRKTLDLAPDVFRLGSVYMISAYRGWWTKVVKQQIREHGGGVWVVGKANVGKSSFIETCFPKDTRNLEKLVELVERGKTDDNAANIHELPVDEERLLPPAPREELFPALPTVSSVPGTTVSPIRIPFGRGKGEMIDLPGVSRGGLENFVRDKHRRDLIMSSRVEPENITVKPGQSLVLLGGLVRITSRHPDDVMMAACFVPIPPHVTRTDKAREIQAGKRVYDEGMSLPAEGFATYIDYAGTFDLKYDVTKSHLPRSIAKALKDKVIKEAPPLPYRVMAVDILIEGCGWVELTVQVRAHEMLKATTDTGLQKMASGRTGRTEEGKQEGDLEGKHEEELEGKQEGEQEGEQEGKQEEKQEGERHVRPFPQVDVFSPQGHHIGCRPPMESYKFISDKDASEKRKLGPRGRQPISKQKRGRPGIWYRPLAQDD